MNGRIFDDLGVGLVPENGPDQVGIQSGGMDAQPIQIIRGYLDHLVGGLAVFSGRGSASGHQKESFIGFQLVQDQTAEFF